MINSRGPSDVYHRGTGFASLLFPLIARDHSRIALDWSKIQDHTFVIECYSGGHVKSVDFEPDRNRIAAWNDLSSE